MSNAPHALEVRNLRFAWPSSSKKLQLEQLVLESKEGLFLYGPSGSGKTSLLYLLSGFLRPQSGSVCWQGQDLSQMTESQMNQFRSDSMSFVFQNFHLISFLSPLENVMAVGNLSSLRTNQARQRSGSSIKEVEFLFSKLRLDFEKIRDRGVRGLSEGEKQRLALARALFGSPKIIFADEPTSSLDSKNRDLFMELILEETKRIEANLIFVSHDLSLKAYFDRSLNLEENSIHA